MLDLTDPVKGLAFAGTLENRSPVFERSRGAWAELGRASSGRAPPAV